MRLSRFYVPVVKQVSEDVVTVSHSMMLRAGMIRQVAAGIYTVLPMGVIVLRKISDIVRQEMENIGCVEVLMPMMQPAKLWRDSGRYDGYGPELFRLHDRRGTEMVLSPTHEEVVTQLLADTVQSYRDLPKIVFHIHWKFRDEIRPRFGMMRCREFLMKDAYSFDVDSESSVHTYNCMFMAYMKIFKRVGLNPVPVQASTGEIGGSMSHEFHILADTGESKLYYDSKLTEAVSDSLSIEEIKEIYTAADEMHDPESYPIPEDRLICGRGIEVGHIFHLGEKYSSSLDCVFTGRDGSERPMVMGCYGIGISRLMAAVVESFHDENGIIWPKSVAPFQVYIINLTKDFAAADVLYDVLSLEFSVLYDDVEGSIGARLRKADLLGMPVQLIIGERYSRDGGVEVKLRSDVGNSLFFGFQEVIGYLRNYFA